MKKTNNWQKEFEKIKLKPSQETSVKFFIHTLLKKEKEEAYSKGEEDAWEEIHDEAIECACRTEQGWCCACSADMMFIEEKIRMGKYKYRGKIEKLIADEILIAQKKGGKISRLISLIHKLK